MTGPAQQEIAVVVTTSDRGYLLADALCRRHLLEGLDYLEMVKTST